MPEELAITVEDVKRAKREIQEAGRARTKIRKLTKKTSKSQLVTTLNFSKLDFDRFDFRILFTEISSLNYVESSSLSLIF